MQKPAQILFQVYVAKLSISEANSQHQEKPHSLICVKSH